MTHLFVCGTLSHLPLLETIVGVPVETRPASLPDHALRKVDGHPFPALVAQPGEQAGGLLINMPSEDASARMAFYESVFGYTLTEVTVTVGETPVTAAMYVAPPSSTQKVTDDVWSLADHPATDLATTLNTAVEVMERRGITPVDELADLLPFIRARAWARVMAQQTGPVTRRRSVTPGDIEITSHRASHDGFFRLKAFGLQTRGYNGAPNPEVQREAYLAFDAALVLPYDPARDLVLLIEQLRFGPLWRGDPEPYTFEPVAGLIDAGESPETTARREAMEEAGVEIDDLIKLPSGYPAPGYVTEFHHCFLAVTDLDPDQAGLGGLASENEDIRSHIMPFETAMALVDSGEICAIPLIMMLMSLATRREALRAHS